MALGTNRDYITTHRNIMKAMRKKYPTELWTCKKCGRKQYPSNDICPRCKTKKS